MDEDTLHIVQEAIAAHDKIRREDEDFQRRYRQYRQRSGGGDLVYKTRENSLVQPAPAPPQAAKIFTREQTLAIGQALAAIREELSQEVEHNRKQLAINNYEIAALRAKLYERRSAEVIDLPEFVKKRNRDAA
jgi:hypothetical protein